MYRLMRTIMSAALILLFGTAQADNHRYTLGIFPYFDPASLALLHKPLKDYIDDNVKQLVSMRSAPSFKAFKKDTTEGKYDIIVTAPHLGRIAQKNSNYEWIGFTKNQSHAVFVVTRESGLQKLSDLKGLSITLPPAAAIIHQMALKRLHEAGVTPNQDIQIKTTLSHNNAMMSVINGVTPIAAFGKPTWDRYSPAGKDRLVKIDQSENIPGFAILVHSRLPEESKTQIQQALLNFENTAVGNTYFDKTGLQGIRIATEKDFEQMDGYLKVISDSRKND